MHTLDVGLVTTRVHICSLEDAITQPLTSAQQWVSLEQNSSLSHLRENAG